MSGGLRVLVVGLASYAMVSTAVAFAIALAWRLGLAGRRTTVGPLLRLRLFPALAGAIVSIGMLLPSFLSHEPLMMREAVGPVLPGLAALSVVLLAHGAWRVLRATLATRRLSTAWRATSRPLMQGAIAMDVIDVPAPIVALVGLWRPRVVVAQPVVQACTSDELAQVAAHEEAHRLANDNLKRLLMLATPDVLSWTPVAAEMVERWHLASEEAADAAAVGEDRQARLALASALVKVARLATQMTPLPSLASPLTGLDGLERRVRRLLACEPAPPEPRRWLPLAVVALAPWCAIPLHPYLHDLIETLVAFGR